MATQEELGQTRTEAPTPRRRQEAREQGQVAFSADLTSGIVLLAGIAALALADQTIGTGLVQCVQMDLLHCTIADLDAALVRERFVHLLGRGLEIIGLVLLMLLAVGVAAPALQVGFHLAPTLLSVNVERLSPAQGWAKMFSLSAGVRGLAALLKVMAAGAVAYWVLSRQANQIVALGEMPLALSLARGWWLAVQLALAIAATLLVLGAADYGWQRWRFEQSLRMTRQELKEELKREEGDPLVKARIRKLQREAAQKRMYHDVPKASVVITNPTHLAVALRYDAAAMAAPRVVAKGAGFVAQRIAEIARRHAVPVVERKPLAQALFKTVEVGREIPTALYVVVAEVLAYVYRLRGGSLAA
jgi:flagellar biosynthetic protein FlhB